MSDPSLIMPCPPPGVVIVCIAGVLICAVAAEVRDAPWLRAFILGLGIVLPLLCLVSWIVGAIRGAR